MPRSKRVSQQMRAESQAQILSAARRLFAEKGYFNCKVSDIAKSAGMSQGNVYWYFPSKEDLLKAVLADGFDALNDLMAQAAARPGAAVEKLDYLLDRYITFAQERGEFTTIFMALMSHGGAPFLYQLGFDTEQIGIGYHQNLGAILSQGRDEGVLAPVDPDVLAVFYFAFFNGLVITYGVDWLGIPRELVRNAVLRLLGVLET